MHFRPVFFLTALAVGCGHSQTTEAPDTPASAPASQPASHPASQPMARLDVEMTQTASLSADSLRQHVYTLAADDMEGRGPATKGIYKAEEYIQKTLEAAGLQPAFNDEWVQPFDMTVGIEWGKKNRIKVGKTRLALKRDFAPYTFSTSAQVKGPAVFAGFGIRSKEHGYDDYANLDVKDRVVVVLDGEPGDDDPKSPFDGTRRTTHAAVRTKLLLAREAGAKALLVIKDQLPQKAQNIETDAGLVTVAVTPGAAKRILGFDPIAKKTAINAAYQPNSTPGQGPDIDLRTEIVRRRRAVHNVAGVLAPKGAIDEAVVIGAHYDHLGYGGSGSLSGKDKPEIHNGADDNASGTSVVLEIARTLAANPQGLRRKIYFILFAGEESGLLGSSHFVKNMPIDKGKVAAMINLDMVGRLRKNRVNVMGVKTAKEFEDLSRRAVEGRMLLGAYGGDGYGPSDHTAFYASGIPVLFLFTGAHTDYHKPSDDPATLNYPGMAKVGAVAADLITALASSTERPEYIKAPPPKLPPGAGRGYGAYFGSIPEFGTDVEGVQFAGVREGSPADKAGVKSGDVLIEFGGVKVLNLRDFTIALRRVAPGETVTFKIRRGNDVLEKKATLVRRE